VDAPLTAATGAVNRLPAGAVRGWAARRQDRPAERAITEVMEPMHSSTPTAASGATGDHALG
jgi:hypothetical protein